MLKDILKVQQFLFFECGIVLQKEIVEEVWEYFSESRCASWLSVNDETLNEDKDILIELAEKLEKEYMEKRLIELFKEKAKVCVYKDDSGDKIELYIDGDMVSEDYL